MCACVQELLRYDTIRYDTRCYFNVRSKADVSQLNLPGGFVCGIGQVRLCVRVCVDVTWIARRR